MKTLAIFLLAAMSAFAADITGKWTFEVVTDQGSGSPSFEFKQDGEKLTGIYKGQFGEAKLDGTVKGTQVDFTITSENGKIIYTGTVESATKMKGKVDISGMATGTFTGTRQ